MRDTENRHLSHEVPQVEHRYGDNVVVLAHPVARTLLARLGSPAMPQSRIRRAVERCYDILLDAALAQQFPRSDQVIPSRIAAFHPGAAVEGEFLDERTAVTIAALARAGTSPARRCYEQLCELVDPDGVRVDHMFMSRRLSATGEVIGVDCRGNKIGGPIDGALLLIPEPMAATGSTMCYTLDLYTHEVGGDPRGIVALHLGVTPEYLRELRARHPQVIVYTLRVDRGLSEPDVLAEVPGTRLADERGLDERQHIVPGIGPIGALVNNSFI
jgi:uracil phosphoribosyltransferase